jgi:hypothetical protein
MQKECAHRLANNVDKACCKSILDDFDDKFLAARADPVVRYANETAISLITHLKDCYAFISPIKLVANYERMCQTYDPSRPVEVCSDKCKTDEPMRKQDNNLTGNSRSLTSHTPSYLTQAFMATYAKNGKKYDILEKTWENFKAHFTTEHRLYRKQTQTAQATGNQAANHAQRNLQDALLVEQSEALAMLASASAKDRTTISHLVSSNSQLSTNLAEKATALTAVNEIICSLRAGTRTSGGSTTASASRSMPNATARARPATNNENYCWSHGYQIREDHTSMTCTRRAEGHQEEAMKANNMGGCQWGQSAV